MGAGLARDDFAFEVDLGTESRAGPLPQGRMREVADFPGLSYKMNKCRTALQTFTRDKDELTAALNRGRARSHKSKSRR